MTHPPTRPLRTWLLIALSALLAACQSLPSARFSPAQISALKAEGFVEAGPGWELTLNERLLFASDQSALQPEQVDHLGGVARHLVSVGILTAQVEGHTDSTGTPAYNLKLSEARAQAVAAPLQANGMRFTPEQIVGRGETLPLSPNDTPEGRADNRRVVVIITPS